MGFEYDLAKAFADELGLVLEIKISDSWADMIPDLKAGQGAFVAANLSITPQRRRRVAFSEGYKTIRQQIIVARRTTSVRTAADLAGRTVDVRRGTSYHERLEALRRGGLDVRLRLHEDLPTEELIRQVADGVIAITVADRHIARLNRRYYPQVRIAGAISADQQLAWAVHPQSRRLQARINAFFRRIKRDGTYARIESRYFHAMDRFDYVDLRAYHRRLRTRLPLYRDAIAEAAERNGFDWRLIAAQIYQESHFDPLAVSPAGAGGLMQITAGVAAAHEVSDIFDPLANIRCGVDHLGALYRFFDQARGTDRLFIALAAYNIGRGHVFDARNIARQQNLDPDKWASLARTLPLLRYPKHYRKARYGYCRGSQPIEYINRIQIYFDILKRQGIRYHPERGRSVRSGNRPALESPPGARHAGASR